MKREDIMGFNKETWLISNMIQSISKSTDYKLCFKSISQSVKKCTSFINIHLKGFHTTVLRINKLIALFM